MSSVLHTYVVGIETLWTYFRELNGISPIPVDGWGQCTTGDDVGVHLTQGYVVIPLLRSKRSVCFGKRRNIVSASHGIWNMAT